jgi:hypothetical protein
LLQIANQTFKNINLINTNFNRRFELKMKEKLFVHHEVVWYIYTQIIFHKMLLKASGLSIRIEVELPNYGMIYQFKYAITLVYDIL